MMNVFNISSTQGPKGPEQTRGSRREVVPDGDRDVSSQGPDQVQDSFAHSDKASRISGLVQELQNGSDTRTQLVDKFKALMDLGQVDTPQAADRAAAAILARDPGKA